MAQQVCCHASRLGQLSLLSHRGESLVQLAGEITVQRVLSLLMHKVMQNLHSTNCYTVQRYGISSCQSAATSDTVKYKHFCSKLLPTFTLVVVN